MVLVTCDRDYLNNRRFPLNQIPAICVLRFGDGSRRDKVRALRKLDDTHCFPHFHDVWYRIDGGPDEWTIEQRFQNGGHSRRRQRFHNRQWQVWINEPGATGRGVPRTGDQRKVSGRMTGKKRRRR
jgi:hypothetical protein